MLSFRSLPTELRFEIYRLLDEPLHHVTDWKTPELVKAFLDFNSRLHDEITSYYHSKPVTLSHLNDEAMQLVSMPRLLQIRNLTIIILESNRQIARLEGYKIKCENAFDHLTIIWEPKRVDPSKEGQAGLSDLSRIREIPRALFNANKSPTGIQKLILQTGRNAVLREDSQFSMNVGYGHLLQWLGVQSRLRDLPSASTVPGTHHKMRVSEAWAGQRLGNGQMSY